MLRQLVCLKGDWETVSFRCGMCLNEDEYLCVCAVAVDDTTLKVSP